ncbi:hypothetical protein TWF730_009017 [Orbilia blumenaviensis]|uniref:Uncharacterized protein n=1 Tax=Orbilia blumenaviensis TaxID=1796055 RepID=A0AAV9UZV6_9PEZI
MSGQQRDVTAAAADGSNNNNASLAMSGGVPTAAAAVAGSGDGSSPLGSAIENDGKEGVVSPTETSISTITTPIPIPTPPPQVVPSLPPQSSTKPIVAPAGEEPELDDFGLPVFKPVISIHVDSSDDEEEGDQEVGRKDDEVDASSRTTGSPVREVDGDEGVSVGEKILGGVTAVATAAAAAVPVVGGAGKKDDDDEKSTAKNMVSPKPLETPAASTPVFEAPAKTEEARDALKALEDVKVASETPKEPQLVSVPELPREAKVVTEIPKEAKTTLETPTEIKAIPKAPKEVKIALPAAEATKTETPSSISKKEEEEEDVPLPLTDINDRAPTSPTNAQTSQHNRSLSKPNIDATLLSPAPNTLPGETKRDQKDTEQPVQPTISSWSHQQSAPVDDKDGSNDLSSRRSSGEWQEMPSYAPYDIYNDDGKLIAKEHHFSDDEDEKAAEDAIGGASKGYTRVQMDEDAQSATSMDDNTGYLFKENEDAEAERNPLSQLETTKDLLTEGQKIAYVGLCKLCMVDMRMELEKFTSVKKSWVKKGVGIGREHMKMWSQIVMVRLYKHMDISPDEQIMIEQLSEHGVVASDLTPTLMKNARVKNPMAAEELKSPRDSITVSPPPELKAGSSTTSSSPSATRKGSLEKRDSGDGYAYGEPGPPAYEEHMNDELPAVRTPSQLPDSKTLDIDIRWTVLCDLFLVLISDSVYDARSRVLLELVGKHLSISWIDICRFEKKVTDALEMQESAAQDWKESGIVEDRARRARNKRYAMMGLATLGGGLVIGLSAGLLAPVIGAGLAAGFTTIGITTTGAFLGGTGGAALITTTAAVSGSAIAGKAAGRRTKSVSVFEFRPLYNSKRVNLIVTISGWMNGKEDDVRLPFSTVDPIMGDIYSVLWEPEMMQSMGQTINILATEVLTQSLQQVLGNTVLMALMASLQVPLILTKLSYLLDNPWNVSLDRAWASGLILADTLIHRNLGVRPITLVGFSLGARVIFSCLMELARRNAHGLVQNVYMFGSPVVVNHDEYMAINGVVRGKFVNGYCTNDWILGYLFRATSGGLGRVAGLAPIEGIPGLVNLDCTEHVVGHMTYRTAIPKLLKKLDWEMISEEFTEIEEADPDQLRERQTELISEIEAARKELEKEPSKRKWGLFGKNKDVAKKADWEVYSEERGGAAKNGDGSAAGDVVRDGDGLDDRDNVLFDVEAIRRELALQEVEDREKAKEEKEKEKNGGGFGTPKMGNATIATPTYDSMADSINVVRSRPGTAKGGTPSSGIGAGGKSPAGTTRGTRTFSFGIFGRKGSEDKSRDASRNSSHVDLSATNTMGAGGSMGYRSSTPIGAGSSPDLTRSSLQQKRDKRGSSGSLEPRSPWAGYSYEDEFGHDDGKIQMTFEDEGNSPPLPPPKPQPPSSSGPGRRAVSYWGQTSSNTGTGAVGLGVRGTSPGLGSSGASSPRVSYDGRGNSEWNSGSGGGGGALPVLNKSGGTGIPTRKSSLGYYAAPGYQRNGSEWGNSTQGSVGSGHGLLGGTGSVRGKSGRDKALPSNPWMEDDEDEFGKEKEMTLSFE